MASLQDKFSYKVVSDMHPKISSAVENELIATWLYYDMTAQDSIIMCFQFTSYWVGKLSIVDTEDSYCTDEGSKYTESVICLAAAGSALGLENQELPPNQEPPATSPEVKYGLIAVAVVCAVNFLLVVGLMLWSRSQRRLEHDAAADTEIQDADDFDTKSQSCDASHDADQISS